MSAEFLSATKFPSIVRDLTTRNFGLWQGLPPILPPPTQTFSSSEQKENEELYGQLRASINSQRSERELTPDNIDNVILQTLPYLNKILENVLGLDAVQIEKLNDFGFVESGFGFLKRALELQSDITREPLLQALPNIWVMNLVQQMFDHPIRLTAAMTPYSLLYPITDNLLDDPEISAAGKTRFNQQLDLKLRGEAIEPSSDYEKNVFALVDQVLLPYEGHHRRIVQAGLKAIHRAQLDGLELQNSGTSLDYKSLLRVSIRKGGVSVLVNGCMVSEYIEHSQAETLFGYGSFLQFQDDLLDLKEDHRSGIATIFSFPGNGNLLDAQIHKLIGFGRVAMEKMASLDDPLPPVLQQVLQRTIDLIPIMAVMLQPTRFSANLVDELEERFPFRFDFIQEQRNDIQTHMPGMKNRLDRFSTMDLIDRAETAWRAVMTSREVS